MNSRVKEKVKCFRNGSDFDWLNYSFRSNDIRARFKVPASQSCSEPRLVLTDSHKQRQDGKDHDDGGAEVHPEDETDWSLGPSRNNKTAIVERNKSKVWVEAADGATVGSGFCLRMFSGFLHHPE